MEAPEAWRASTVRSPKGTVVFDVAPGTVTAWLTLKLPAPSSVEQSPANSPYPPLKGYRSGSW